MKRITRMLIEEYDRINETSLIRELEIAVDSCPAVRGITIQFFEDLRLYGLDEAVTYLRGNVTDSPVETHVMPTVRRIHELFS